MNDEKEILKKLFQYRKAYSKLSIRLEQLNGLLSIMSLKEEDVVKLELVQCKYLQRYTV